MRWWLIEWTRVHAIDGSSLNLTSAMRPRHLHHRTVWGYSLTRRKYLERKRLNRGTQSSNNCVTAPLSYQGPTIPVGPPYANRPHMPHGAPHTRPRGPVRVASCHASAPPAPRASQLWLCHVALVPRHNHVLVLRATSARRLGPLATSSPAGN